MIFKKKLFIYFFWHSAELVASWAAICFPAGESKVEADYLTSVVWSPRAQIWWNLIHRLIRFCRSARGRAVWHHDYPPRSLHHTWAYCCCRLKNLVTPTCWGNFTAFTWWAALSFAGWVNSWGALWNIHGCQAAKEFYTVCVSIHVENVYTWVCVWLCTMCREGKKTTQTTLKCRRFLNFFFLPLTLGLSG